MPCHECTTPLFIRKSLDRPVNLSDQVDALIVGQGLAGTLLAARLLARGASVLVVDDGHRSASTRMAAGLLNPVTGLRLTKLRQAERFVPEALQCYAELERRWGAVFFHPKPMLRLFRSERQRADWDKRLQKPDYAPFLQPLMAAADVPDRLHAPHGAGLQRQTGYLDTVTFLDTGRRWLQQQGALHEGVLDWSSLRMAPASVQWEGVVARWVIGCEGYRGEHNPWFSWLPFRPCKGRILTLETHEPLPDWILNRGTWLLPLGAGRVRVGATYEREAVDGVPGQAPREQLLAEADDMFRSAMGWRLIDEATGVRPGCRDRMPLVGLHPVHGRLGMCNGFGSKGVLMAPYYTRCLVETLLEGAPLPEEASLQRWWNPHGPA